MKDLLVAISDRLKTEVGELMWVDYDDGQIDVYDEQPNVEFPCALIRISLLDCKDICDGAQQCNVELYIRLAFNKKNTLPLPSTDEESRDQSLLRYDFFEKVYCALQGFEIKGCSPLDRGSFLREERNDDLIVHKLLFNSVFMDYSAS